MAGVRNTFTGDMYIGGTTADGNQLKITGSKQFGTMLALQNLDPTGYSSTHLFDSAGKFVGVCGWANANAPTHKNSVYVGTTAGSNATVQIIAEDVTAIHIEPTRTVHMDSAPLPTGGRLRVRSDAGYAIGTYGTANHIAMQFVRDINGTPSERGAIFVTDTGVTYGSSSDRTLKNDRGLHQADKAWEVLRLVKIHNFDWISNGQAEIGPFAQELYEVYPNAVIKGGWFGPEGEALNAVTVGASYRPWAVDNAKLIPLIMVAIQDIDRRLLALEAR